MDPILTGIFVIVFFLLLSAFFSGTETALTSLSPLKTKQLKELHGKTGKALDLWLNHPQKVLSSILIANTVVNIYSGIYADHFMNEKMGISNPIITLAIITSLTVMFGEILPKTLAKNFSTLVAIPLINLLKIPYYVLYPFTYLTSGFVKFVSYLFIKSETKSDHQITQEELEFLINASEEEGVLEENKHNMLSGVFELGDTVVREVMVHRIDMIAVSVNTAIFDSIDIFRDTGLSRIPVYEDRIDNILGIIHAKDAMFFLKKNKDTSAYYEAKVTEIKRDTLFVPESKPVDQLFQDLRKQRQHIAIVLDEYGGTNGIVTMEDIFEEIVGEVRDEFDNEEDVIRPTNIPNQYAVECKIHIDDFCDFFDLDVNEICDGEATHEFDTLAGLILFNFGQLPKINDQMDIKNVHIEVIEVSRRRVRKALVSVKNINATDNIQS